MRPNLTKQEALESLLAAHRSIYVHLDTRHPGVIVPEALRGQPQLALQLGYNMAIPIADLHCDDNGWSATLSFGRRPFFCAVPWGAVFFIVSETGIGCHWPLDTPPEVVVQREGEEAKPALALRPKKTVAAVSADAVTKKLRLPAGWIVIDGGKKEVAAADGGGRGDGGGTQAG